MHMLYWSSPCICDVGSLLPKTLGLLHFTSHFNTNTPHNPLLYNIFVPFPFLGLMLTKTKTRRHPYPRYGQLHHILQQQLAKAQQQELCQVGNAHRGRACLTQALWQIIEITFNVQDPAASSVAGGV